jgi:hypothetical protein
MARITVEKGYNYLKQQGIIDSVRGKGFFIKVDEVPRNLRIFLLFNKLSVHKKIIYDAFVKSIGDQGSIDFYIYNNDFNLFKKIVDSRDRDYTHMVLIPHFMEGEEMAIDLINSLPKEKLVLLDKLLPGIQGKFGAVYEDFEHDTTSQRIISHLPANSARFSGAELLSKRNRSRIYQFLP